MPQPTSRIIHAGTLKLHALDWGSEGQPPLIFLHGLASSAHMFDLVAPAFTSAYHVLAVDQRGHGLSDKPDTGYDFETIAADLDHFLAEIGYAADKIVLVGHSGGACTALYYAATRPDRVAKLILIDGGIRIHQDEWPTWEEAQQKMAPPRYNNMSVADIKTMIRERWLRDIYRPELEPLALSIYDLSDPVNVHANLSFDNHMQIAHSLWEIHVTDYFPRVTCPTLIITAIAHGNDMDPKVHAFAEQAESLLQRGELVWMRDTIHDIPWHRPDELAQIIQGFLDGQDN